MSSHSADDEQLERVRIASLFAESVLYGMFLISFVFAMRHLVLDESGHGLKHRVHWYFVGITFLLFALASVDVCLGLVRVLRLDVNAPTTGVDTMLVIGIFIVIVVVDAVLVYRCWIVYARTWKAIICPGALWLATTAMTVIFVWKTIALNVGTPVDSSVLEHSLQAILSLTIGQNIISTGLIAWRIWSVDRESARYRVDLEDQKSRLQIVTRIVVDSGLLCTFSALCSFISFWANKDYAGFVASDMEMQLVGIAFNLIIIRTADERRDTLPSSAPVRLSFRAAERHTVTEFDLQNGLSRTGVVVRQSVIVSKDNTYL